MVLTAAECLAGIDIIEPQISPDGRFIAVILNGDRGPFIYRIEIDHPDWDLRGPQTQQAPRSASSLYDEPAWSPWPVRSGRSLGGGSFAWLPDSTGLVVVARTGDLWTLPLSGEPHCVFESPRDLPLDDSLPSGVFAPAVDSSGRYVAVTADQAQIWTIDLVTGRSERQDGGDHDFVLDPVWWNGRPLWTAWNIPNMPWDESVLVNADAKQFGPRTNQVQQARVAPSGGVWGWLDDASGWLNVQIADGLRIDEMFEHGGPSWGERQRSWCFNSMGTQVAFARNEEGFGRLCSADIDTGVVVERARAIHGQLSWAGNTLVAVRTGGKTPTSLVVYNTGDTNPADQEWLRRDVLVGPSAIVKGHPSLVEPQLVTTQSIDGADLFARLYQSPRSQGRLLCWIHGGPTDQWTVSFMPRFTFWLDRGYDILVPDHRGSTGHGRAFAQALHGRWGDMDVDDVHRLIEYVVQRQPGTSVALMGSSAGGMTALGVAARYPKSASAAVLAYPVSDMAALDGVTHRFEAHYNRSLLGSPEQTQRLSQMRSPSHHVAALAATPLLIFHGSQDPVVPLAQSEQLVAGLRRHGGDVNFVVFDGEGHGFRDLNHKITEFERTEEFLQRHL